MLWFERTFNGDADVVCLLFREGRQLHANTIEVQARNFLVEVLREDVNTRLVLITFGPKFDLSQNLVGEGCGHHERRVTSCVT